MGDYMNANDVVEFMQVEEEIFISKQKRMHLTFEERIEIFKKLPDNEKGNVEPYDWGEDLGKEIFD